MKPYLPILISLLGVSPLAMAADLVTSIPMETDGMSRIKEQTGGINLNVKGGHTDENIKGAEGYALRFDGYTTYVEGNVPVYNPEGASSFSMWVAPETYPIVLHDQPTTEKITLAGTINHTSRTGWAFSLDKNGKYSFDCYAGGWLASVEAPDILPCYEWSHLVAVNDPSASTLTLYRNGEELAQVKSLGPIGNGDSQIIIGKTAGSPGGAYSLNTFNGLIDDINVYDGIIDSDKIIATPQNPADLSIPESRFAKDLLRPIHHGMPGANWTNETHGMVYSDGRYHVFFQKNANGPYMSRLHWGHITSDDLYDWTEEKIALAPGESYDTKGCWSGCVFTDNVITGGLPNIIYTGVDYTKAYIAQAVPTDASLIGWEKKGIIINGRPSGLSDDFRDPYFFRNGDDAYIIVGTSKDNKGATTLHKYNESTGTWSNDGEIFFAASTPDYGTFWEMPNVTPMGNGKWLFTCTPLNPVNGVHTLYWIGSIGNDGKFTPDTAAPVSLELINGQGYGLLSPTIYQHNGKTILMGIVPDKLSTEENCTLGWAHLYSFPREISVDAQGNLVQKPYSGLEALRSEEGNKATEMTLDGVKPISGIGGRQYEVKGVFKVGSVPFGFNLFKNGKGYAAVSYNPSDNRLSVNMTKLNRKVNDRNSFNGNYVCTLPEKPEAGSDLTLDIFVDGSILDIFVNDRWATSVRIFPNDADANEVEVFSEGGVVNVKELQGWLLGDATYEDDGNGDNGNGSPDDPDDAGIDGILSDLPEYVNVYSLNGMLVKRNIKTSELATVLPKGVYIVGSYKIVI